MTHNPYGRQIFLTRKEINTIKAMIEWQEVSVNDDIRRLETECKNEFGQHSLKTLYEYKINLEHRRQELAELEKMDKKMFYYVDKGEVNGQQHQDTA